MAAISNWGKGVGQPLFGPASRLGCLFIYVSASDPLMASLSTLSLCHVFLEAHCQKCGADLGPPGATKQRLDLISTNRTSALVIGQNFAWIFFAL
tara:strand:- start:413 stop:697 length:285 start_codon:yes stop_codon:yes gene_type:complete